MRAKIILLLVLWSAMSGAEEPGQFNVENVPAQKAPGPYWLLSKEFLQARGLYGYEVRGLHFNRVSCDRRLFAPSGRSLEGDGDLKVTNIDPGFIEVEFPSHFSFVNFGTLNPYGNGVAEVETIMSRQLMKVRDWADGESLKLEKYVEVRFAAEGAEPQVALAVDEVRVVEGAYPTTFLVRETIFLPKTFSAYFICR